MSNLVDVPLEPTVEPELQAAAAAGALASVPFPWTCRLQMNGVAQASIVIPAGSGSEDIARLLAELAKTARDIMVQQAPSSG